MKQSLYGGIDLGGSHIGLTLVTEDGTIVATAATDVELIKSAEKEKALIDLIVSLVNACVYDRSAYEIKALSAGVPGIFVGTKIISLVNMGINNFDIGAELKRRFPEMGLNEDVSIFLENDAAAAAIYEVVAQKGGLLNAENGSFYGLGSGLGVCLVKNGVVLPCEGGHVTLDFHEISEEYLCGCGQIGCAEVYTSVLRFRRKITQVLGLTVSDDKNIDQTLNGIETEYIIRISYNDSTPDCLLKKLTPEKIQEIQDRLTTMRKNKILRLYDNWIKAIIATLTSNVNLCATDRIVIGGSGAFLIRPDDFCHIQDAVNKRNNLYRGKKEVTILKSNAPMDAGVIGAALIPVYRKQISK